VENVVEEKQNSWYNKPQRYDLPDDKINLLIYRFSVYSKMRHTVYRKIEKEWHNMRLRYNLTIDQFNSATRDAMLRSLEQHKKMLSKSQEAPQESIAARSIPDIKARIEMMEYYLAVYDQVLAGKGEM